MVGPPDVRPAAAADASAMSTDSHIRPLTAVSGVLWIWVESILALTFALIVLGGFFVLEDTTVRIVLAVLLVGEAVHLWLLHRRRAEAARDPRLRHHRERRGF